jgi:hypothetical protein
MVVEPADPARTVPLAPLTATGTLLRAMFSKMRLPVDSVELCHAVVTKTGVFVMVLSRILTEPTSWFPTPPLLIEIAVPQLVIDKPW